MVITNPFATHWLRWVDTQGTRTATTIPQTWSWGGTVPTWINTVTANGTNGVWFDSSMTTGGTNGVWLTNPTYTNTLQIIDEYGDISREDWEEFYVTPGQRFDLARRRVYICRERMELEDRRARERAEERRIREAEYRLAQERALRRSRDLLLSGLTAAQRKTMEENGWFVVKGGKTGRDYKIHTNRFAGNINILKGDKVVGTICCHCDNVPLHDHHVAQRLAILYDEERFLKVANVSRVA